MAYGLLFIMKHGWAYDVVKIKIKSSKISTMIFIFYIYSVAKCAKYNLVSSYYVR